MTTYFINISDNPGGASVFSEEDPLSGKMQLKSKYNHLTCIECKKVDENRAFDGTILTDVSPVAERWKRGMIATDDQVPLIVSEKGEALLGLGIQGLRLVPLVRSKYSVFFPINSMGIQNPLVPVKKVCSLCGRPRLSSGLPGLKNLDRLPSEKEIVWISPFENRSGSSFVIYCGKMVPELFKETDIIGAKFIAVDDRGLAMR